MIRIDIRPVWRFRAGTEREFDFQLIAILDQLEATAKLTEAAKKAGVSYRHAWNLITEWERFFGAALVDKEQGVGTRLTPLGKRLLLAGRRAEARLAPELGNLAAEFARSLNETLSGETATLLMHASHDFAIEALKDLCAISGPAIDLQSKGSFDALGALRRRECEVAGFHLPEGPFGKLMAMRYAECLPHEEYCLIDFVHRTQGLIVRPGNPRGIKSVTDLCRADVRFVNRQRGSGTRALFEFMVSSAGLDRDRIQGYDDEETTHAAVAALVAGGQVDAGFGVEAAAAHYRLGFVPVCRERYFLACRSEDLESPTLAAFIATLRSASFRERVAELPGYSAPNSGAVLESLEAVTDTAA
jgi:molybdate transport repressor ModE-like protein